MTSQPALVDQLPAPRAPQTTGAASALPLGVRAALVVNVVAQVLIVVTGGLVRLTGSGLGCPTWPQCVPGSYVPVEHQAQGIHKYIEFGNRTLTGMVGLTALAVLVAVWLVVRRDRRPRSVLALAAVPLVGVVVQAVLGGITVLTHLSPATVAAHFLVSAVIVVASFTVLERVRRPDGAASWAVRVELQWLAWALAVLTGVVLLLGTVVTGSGPHSGDADAPARFGLDPRSMSWLHADAVMLWFGVLLALLVALRLTDASPRSQRAALLVVGVGLAQGVIGYAQYFAGLPVAVVALHMLGACLLVVAVANLVLSLRVRSDLPSA
ncbi:MAG TPA: COX15/CtaA family protein [Actinomycetales bacterium]|nr:COX15/CtaA family protein [Actinomycetales bacterium]